ncbi:helix-turn-helix domain-containing protein [Reinekea blandensis]|uniref:Helix-turn-helix domain-containing protein n=1 Tax=Reinekea blandensis MED297 TaxID=314283 RepID=A4BC01_9GAMM|nr:helix-turn-helix domain-containing protein [Reinekea blandensis]EAR10486.1 hypothetical protein MED297_01655 [Reinekea sp. MED297] [Reinekea blandensis MED297]
MSDQHFTIDQAAKLLGVTEVTLKRYIRENLLPTEDVQGMKMLPKDAVQRYKAIQDRLQRR